MDVDVGSSYAGATIFNVVKGSIKSLVIDLAFLLEGQAVSELPEQILTGVRIFHVDLDTIFKQVPIIE